jgi:hypothetical protein
MFLILSFTAIKYGITWLNKLTIYIYHETAGQLRDKLIKWK